MPESLNIHAVIPRSRVNGPGTRLVVFFQGCARNCYGCFNPGTHSFEQRELVTPEALLGRHLSKGIEGTTVSGGEPFSQPKGLLRLLELAASSGLSTLVYTGFRLEEVMEDEARVIINAKCTMCHITSAAGNLSLKTYADALKGGQSGPAIVPGDLDKSVLVKTQRGTSHPAMGMLTPEELAAIIAWIEAGAPEK